MAFYKAESREHQILLLGVPSMVLTNSQIQEAIPEISTRLITEARKAMLDIETLTTTNPPTFYERYSQDKVEYFVSYITRFVNL